MTVTEAVNRHREEIEDSDSIIDHVVDGAIGRALNRADARTIFGEATTQGDCTVIPVGRVNARYAFGGGSGEGTSSESGGQVGTGEGGGGGGTLEVKPIGYIEVTSSGSRFMPITDGSAIAIRAVTMGGIVAIMLVVGIFSAIGSRRKG